MFRADTDSDTYIVYCKGHTTKGNSKINQNFFSKKRIACSVKYCFPMCMFEVNKNRNILQFANFL